MIYLLYIYCISAIGVFLLVLSCNRTLVMQGSAAAVSAAFINSFQLGSVGIATLKNEKNFWNTKLNNFIRQTRKVYFLIVHQSTGKMTKMKISPNS